MIGANPNTGVNENTYSKRIKIVCPIDEYNLGDIGDLLEHRWTTGGDDRMSLRDLAGYLDQQASAAAMADVEIQPLSSEVKNAGRLLTADDVGSGGQPAVIHIGK